MSDVILELLSTSFSEEESLLNLGPMDFSLVSQMALGDSLCLLRFQFLLWR